MSRNIANIDNSGQDAFLDIIANLVGVLIILVVIVGAQAGGALQQKAVAEKDEDALHKLRQQIQNAAYMSRDLKHDNDRLEENIVFEQGLTDALKDRRSELMLQVELARKRLQQVTETTDADRRQEIQQQILLDELQTSVQQTRAQYTVLKTAREKSRKTIEHYPTPIAKTVFRDEVHFRLAGGRVHYVPLDELVQVMRGQWKVAAEALQGTATSVETVGPVEGFRLQYQLESFVQTVPTEMGPVEQRGVRLQSFVVRPDDPRIGQDVSDAIKPGSRFRKTIDRLNPEKTTISVWVYPDSYEEFSELKKWLYANQFATAVWPLPQGQPISAGPNGFNSSAQ